MRPISSTFVASSPAAPTAAVAAAASGCSSGDLRKRPLEKKKIRQSSANRAHSSHLGVARSAAAALAGLLLLLGLSGGPRRRARGQQRLARIGRQHVHRVHVGRKGQRRRGPKGHVRIRHVGRLKGGLVRAVCARQQRVRRHGQHALRRLEQCKQTGKAPTHLSLTLKSGAGDGVAAARVGSPETLSRERRLSITRFISSSRTRICSISSPQCGGNAMVSLGEKLCVGPPSPPAVMLLESTMSTLSLYSHGGAPSSRSSSRSIFPCPVFFFLVGFLERSVRNLPTAALRRSPQTQRRMPRAGQARRSEKGGKA